MIKSSTIPLSNVEGQETGLDPQYNEREEMEFSWNEKIFSPREFEQYREERNCKTPLESEYHHRILKLISDGVTSTSNRLFTYISKDRVPTDVSVDMISLRRLEQSFFLITFLISYIGIFFMRKTSINYRVQRISSFLKNCLQMRVIHLI